MELWIILLICIGISNQCEDIGGKDYCITALLQKSNICKNLEADVLANCHFTCEVCKPTDKPVSQGNNNAPPAFAWPPPGTRKRPDRKRPTEKPDDENPLVLPVYVVVLIVVAVLIIFIGITVCVVKLKKKWKKRKLAKNRKLLENAAPPTTTMPRSYLWAGGSYNCSYQPEMDGWARNMYLPGDAEQDYGRNKTLNNAVQPHARQKTEKNINILQNGTKDKRRAPPPPQENADAESTYQNLHQTTNAKLDSSAKMKTTAQPERKVVEIPIEYSESVMSEAIPQQDAMQNNEAISNNYVSWNDTTPPVPPPRIPNNDSKKSKKQNNVIAKEAPQIESDRESDESLENSTVRLKRSISELTENTQETSPALANILNEWKEHLQEQKKELEDYYKNLANYVKRLGLKPVGAEQHRSTSNDRAMQELMKSNSQKHRNRSEPLYNDLQYASVNENYSAALKFPEPPESVRGDFIWEPNDAASQKQVIVDLKKKLARLQNLLESTQEMTESDKKSSAYYIPSQHSKNSKYAGRNNAIEDRVTIKALLRKLEERERLKVQMRIAQALDTSRNRGGMNIGSRDGPITCLSKQVHHVMNDILDPRTSTKIELGAHAACTLANKLGTNVRTNLLPVLNAQSPKQSVAKTTDRIAILTKQLLDMTKQLMARQGSFQSKDYSVFVNAFVDTTEKIMDTTFHLVCVIVDLQRAERRGLISKRTQNRQPSRNIQRPSLPLPETQDKNHLLSRLHSESNSTSLSAVDVRQLNEDLAKLRQLLNTETQLPSLSDVTISPNIPPHNYNGNLDLEFDTDMPESDCETMSTISCSTCMPIDDDQYFYSGDMPPHPMYLEPPKFPSQPFSNSKKKNEDKVNYTEIVFDPETHRPATRPHKAGNNLTLPVDISEKPKPPSAGAFDLASQVESRKNSHKASTLDPSSFASYHSNNDVVTAEAQPRHEAMLARYFGGETIQPQITEPEKLRDRLKEALQQQAALTRNVSDEQPPDAEGECPMVTMLPCGLVANDTPPIANPPKEKRVKLPDIPEITVLRNGTEQSLFPVEGDEDKKENENSIKADEVEQNPDEANLKEPYEFTDTLPLHEKPKPNIEHQNENYKDNESDQSSLPDSFSEKLCADFSDDEGNFKYDFPLEDSDEVIAPSDEEKSSNEEIPETKSISSSSSSNFNSVVNRDSVETARLNSYPKPSIDRSNVMVDPNITDNDGLVSEFEFPRVKSFANENASQPEKTSQNAANTYVENDQETPELEWNNELKDVTSPSEILTFSNEYEDRPQSGNHELNTGSDIKHSLENAANAISPTDKNTNLENPTVNNNEATESIPHENDNNEFPFEDVTVNEPIYDVPAEDDRIDNKQYATRSRKKFHFKMPNIFSKKKK